MTTLGQRIRDRRQELGLTVRGFARDIGVTPPAVTDIEADRRRPRPKVLAKIAEVLYLPLEELEALDPRVSPEVKQWMEQDPRVSSLLRRLQQDPDPSGQLRRIERVFQRDDEEDEEA